MTGDPLGPLVDAIADAVAARITAHTTPDDRLPTLAVTAPVAAEALGVSTKTVHRLIDAGHLTTLDGTTAVRVTVASLHAYAGQPMLPVLHEVAS